jgi:hypothetical protein
MRDRPRPTYPRYTPMWVKGLWLLVLIFAITLAASAVYVFLALWRIRA